VGESGGPPGAGRKTWEKGQKIGIKPTFDQKGVSQGGGKQSLSKRRKKKIKATKQNVCGGNTSKTGAPLPATFFRRAK